VLKQKLAVSHGNWNEGRKQNSGLFCRREPLAALGGDELVESMRRILLGGIAYPLFHCRESRPIIRSFCVDSLISDEESALVRKKISGSAKYSNS
jgi:hypothetical protein